MQWLKRLSKAKGLMGMTVLVGLLSAAPAFAQLQTGIEAGGPFQQALGLGTGDIRIIIANIIRVALLFLGVIAVSLIVYGGFLWMTSAGNEERVQKAKSVIINAVIGLVIIMSSYAITAFVIGRLLTATGAGGGTEIDGGDGFDGGPTSTSSLFTPESVSPQGDQTIKNLTVRMTFNRDVDATTVESGITIAESGGGSAVSGNFTVDGDRVSFQPDTLCDGYEDQYCFSDNTAYTVSFSGSLLSEDGLALSCGGLYESCDYDFTSGDLVDTIDPAVEISYPDDGDSVSVDAFIPLQATVIDDGGVSLVEFYVGGELIDTDQPEGDTPLSFNAEIEWDTSNVEEGSRESIYAVAYDVNDHDATSEDISVIVRAAHCFNGDKDEDEELEDCGGADCGSCGGAECSTSFDCQSGVCENGVCVDYPEITGISPGDGAVGTYVTISGNNFGSSTGTVNFGEAKVELAECADAWSTSQVIVVVPDSLVAGESYKFQITTADGYSDTNQDDNGSLVDDFEVNTTVRPGICSVSPDADVVGAIVSVGGINFGSEQGTSGLFFGEDEADTYTSWADDGIKATVPTLVSDDYDVTVWVDGVSSNEVNFYVEDPDAEETPVIASLDPESGPIGEYVTITGSGFGTTEGIVYFTDNNPDSETYGVATAADVEFPDACQESWWSRTQIVVKVPNDIKETDYLVGLTRQDGVASNELPFTVTAGEAGPGVCLLEPSAGPAGLEGVILTGERFRDDAGSVTFFDGQNATIESWSDGEVIVSVPDSAATGVVVLTDENDNVSNETNFEVGDCNEIDICDANTQQCCASGACVAIDGTCPEAAAAIEAEYVWQFSTGIIPTVPQIEIGCSDDVISPTPWDGRSGGSSVCVNAGVSATFDIMMDTDTFGVNDSINLAKCTGTGTDPCASTTAVTLGSLATTSYSFTAFPSVALDASSTYQVSLTAGITSATGTAIDATTWTFETSASSQDCEVAGVNISPSSATIEELNGTAAFTARTLADDICIILNSENITWNWSTDGTFANLVDDDDDEDDSQSAIGVQEGTSYVLAEESSLGLDDHADLFINFSNPYAIDYWPNCSGEGTACRNAAVGAQFSTPMDEVSAETLGAVSLYWCSDEVCDDYVENVSVTVALSDSDPTIVNITPTDDLNATTYYEVVFDSGITSASGVPLSEYYSGDFNWIFQTRTSEELCGIDHIEMSPASTTVDYVGATAVFDAVPFSDADDCSTAGERLTSTGYDWTWAVEDALIAELWSGGDVIVTPTEIPAGCTASCLSEGTDSYTAICGADADANGSDVDPGEDCDGSAGCSASCETAGTTACASSTDAGCCGNNTLDTGEECDDGNTTSRDSCSSSCLNEGTRGGNTTCGDAVVTQYTLLNSAGWAGGEDCDTADPTTSEGCAADCTNEGSTPAPDIVGVCGNNVVEDPAEECDDGDTDPGDGCSEHCLFEGSASCDEATDTNCCGNGSLDESAFESCDDGNGTSGDGCSARCLLEGSDATRATPSWCGDGVLDVSGAESDPLYESPDCEINLSELDTSIEPEQVAVIVETAPGQVVDGIATTVVSATTASETGEGELNLSCSCESDSQCSDATTIGCGIGGCCYLRPEATSYTPSGADACRNTLISIDFDTEMDLATFDGNVLVGYDNGSSTCPYETIVRFDDESSGIASFWQSVTNFVRNLIAPAQAISFLPECFLPVTFEATSISGGQRVSIIYDQLLESGGQYVVIVEGDPEHDGTGVRSADGVGMDADYTFDIDVGTNVCSFDSVSVEDADPDSPGLFTQENEQHTYTATAVTSQGGVEEAIISIPGSYDWDWSQTWWSTDQTILTVPVTGTDTDSTSSNTVTAEGENGEAAIYASAKITDDTFFDPSTENDVVSGSADVTANLCENSWPAVIEGETWGPFEDSAVANLDPDGDGVDEIAARTAYTNFSTYYCRDAGDNGVADDYDAADVVGIETPPSGVLKEYLFELSGSDAIGIRVVANSDLLSISDWYAEQGFTGSPEETEVDGYEALSDGRTVYVSAANVNGASASGTIYPNVYVISYNEGASTETIAVFEQMLANWTFNTNLDNDQLCYESTGEPSTDTEGGTVACSSDLDCASGICRADKDKLTRDLTRLTDMRQMVTDLDAYGEEHGRCSATTSTSCTADEDCPGSESCDPLFPTVESGSFLRSVSSSAWDSWSTVFAEELGTSLPVDPLNDYAECGATGGTFENYNADTCWYEAPALYACPEGSHVYFYRNVGGINYELKTDLEFDYVTGTTEWSADVDTVSDGLTVLAGLAFADTTGGYQEDATCDGTPIGSSEVCGDGVIGATEYCEIGQTSTDTCTVSTCVSADPDYDGLSCNDINCADASLCSSTEDSDGTQITTCRDTSTGTDDFVCSAVVLATSCTGYDDTTTCAANYVCAQKSDSTFKCVRPSTVDCSAFGGDCSAYSGVSQCVQLSEESSACEDYELASDAECVPLRCGNGVVEGPEVGGTEECDDGSHNGDYGYCGSLCTIASGFYCGDGTLAGSEACDEGADNGVYTALAADSCNATCSGPGTYCGDDVVNGSEQCDGAEEWAGELCYTGSDAGEPCTVDGDCENGQCGAGYFCDLNASVSCTSLTDTTSCGSWGTCVVESAAIDDYFCALPIDPLDPYAVTCTGLSDTSCPSGSYCSEYAAGSYACLMIGPYCSSANAYSTSICPPLAEAVPCGHFLTSATYTCESDNDTECSGTTDVTTCQALDSALECTGAGSEYGACGTGTVCEDYDDAGDDCTDDTNCDSGSCVSGVCESATDVGDYCTDNFDCQSENCSDFVYDLTRSRECSTSCTTGSWSDCVRSGESCGNGEVEGTEECDDGNESNNDACTNNCTENTCGDGYLYSGQETCDMGSDNGAFPDDCAYDSTCRYCSVQCVYLTASGEYCGDGVAQEPAEFCDGSDLTQYRCYDSDTEELGDICTTLGSTSECDSGYTCHNMGLCNGGGTSGDFCTADDQSPISSGTDLSLCNPGTSECIAPSCADDCGSTCPFSYDPGVVSVTSEEAGATPQTGIDLYSSDGNDSPNLATLTIPACTVAGSLSANISDGDRELPNVDIMFILDRSVSMSYSLGSSTRLAVLRDSVNDAIDQLYEAYDGVDAEMNIGFSYFAGLHATDSDSSGSYSSSELAANAFAYEFATDDYFLTDDDESDLVSAIDTTMVIPSDQDSGTPLTEGLADAIDAFNSDPDVEADDKKYIVLFTDGAIWNSEAEITRLQSVYGLSGTAQDDYVAVVTALVDAAKADDIEVFSATFTSDDCDEWSGERWSSDSCTADASNGCIDNEAEGNYDCSAGENGITYAYSATDADGIAEMYQSIIDSILDVTVTITDEDGNTATDTVDIGDSIELPLPSAFACDDAGEKEALIEISFTGDGTISFDDIQINMCAP